MSNPSLARLYSAARPDPATLGLVAPLAAEDRSEERLPVAIDATLMAHQKGKLPISVSDLSRHGCCIGNAPLALRPGQFISIKLGSLDYLQAIVRWIDGDHAGIEFTQALHPAVFEHVAHRILPD